MASVVLGSVGSYLGGPIGGFVGSKVGGFVDNLIFGEDQQLPDVVGPRLADLSAQVSTYGRMLPLVYGRTRLAGNVIWTTDPAIREERVEQTTTQSGGKGGGGSVSQTNVTFNYYATLAVAITGGGPIDKIERVWADSLLLNEETLSTNEGNYEVYLGTQDQLPSPIIESFLGAGNVPAYRGVSYVVIKDLPLAKFGNRIPNFTFEVINSVRFEPSVEDQVKEIMMIPASGEFVYSMDITKKLTGERDGAGNFVDGGSSEFLNMQNFNNKPNARLAVDNLLETFPNIEYVAIGVSWFATSKNPALLNVIPKVEFGSDTASVTPHDWVVGSYNRGNAQEVLRLPDGNATYGGTPTDRSIVQLAIELKSRQNANGDNLKVLWYPLMLIDTLDTTPGEDNKPWRGRITPSSTGDVTRFFNGAGGYNAFIMHYANLNVAGVGALKDHIDAFIIGSEMVSLTTWDSGGGNFPAVSEFVSLAASVKSAVGSGVKVSYAADWTEYHSTNGYFHMDPLWSSSNIDFIAIDAYFPLTPDLPQSQISETIIEEYWAKGEGYEYFYDDSGARTSNFGVNPIGTTSGSGVIVLTKTNHNVQSGQVVTLSGFVDTNGITAEQINSSFAAHTITATTFSVTTAGSASSTGSGGGSTGAGSFSTNYTGDEYAWKNIEYWWDNTHTNPGAGSPTAWTAQAKPLWFTEYGFPSVDGCANQPNVFYDPNSIESFFPRGSKGRIDFSAQRMAIKATLDFWEASRVANPLLVEKMFLWTWDARPFPQWPDLTSFWADGSLWGPGHWVQGKFGASSLGAIIADLLNRVGLTSSDYDTSRLTDTVEGYVITRADTVRNLVERLQSGFFFDMVESNGILKFVKRSSGQSSVTVPSDDIIPSSESGVDELMEIKRKQELDLPKRVTITHIDRVLAYQSNSQFVQRHTSRAVDHKEVRLPIVMSSQQGRTAADVHLYNAWVSRNSFRLRLPIKYGYLEPTDLITISLDGVNHLMRILDIKFLPNGVLEVNASSEDVSTYDFYSTPGELSPVQITPSVADDTNLVLLDINAMPSDTRNSGVVRVAMAPSGSTWDGGSLYRSDDGGEDQGNTWALLTSTNTPAVMGKALTLLGDGTTDVIDTGNTVDIFLTNGSLSSITEQALFNGGNVAVLGEEIIQFQTVEILDGNSQKLRLSSLLRGRQGTEHTTGTHAFSDDFVLLDSRVLKLDMPPITFGLGLHYKPLSVGQGLTDVDEVGYTYEGKTLKPWSPVQVAAKRDSPSTNDWTLNWVRRTRFGGEFKDNGLEPPLNEAYEKYEIDFLDGSGNVVATKAVSDLTSYIYTEADQIADFGSAQSTIRTKIYQMSDAVGRGYDANNEFTG